MNKYSITISKLINGGYGLGQLEDGRMAMVRYTLPGEQITISIEKEKKSYLIGKLLTVHRENTHRIAAPCPLYGICGGCDLQHAEYEEQLRIKNEIIQDLLSRQIQTDEGETVFPVKPISPSPGTSSYRQRIRLVVKNGRSCGFRKHQSHEVVEVTKCYIAKSEINEVLGELSSNPLFSRMLAHCSELELLWNPASGSVSSLFHLTRKPRPTDFSNAKELIEAIPLLERVFFAGQMFPLVASSPASDDNTLGIVYPAAKGCFSKFVLNWEVGGFCQVNLDQNMNLLKIVCEMAAIQNHETVLDLYCGAGNFSIPLAQRAKSLVGIEGQGSAIRSAKANAALSALSNTSFHKQSIHTACEEREAAGESYDCLVIDPPRQGIPGLSDKLYALCRSRLVYISCDPATLCRDLSDLIYTGFSIVTIQPVDMFPQTHHIETVVLLEKN